MKYGDIIIVSKLLDPNGVNPKGRACLLISRDETNAPDASVRIIAISTRFPEPLDAFHVLLPWDPNGHPRTGLRKRSAAVCTWQADVEPDRVLNPCYDFVPGRIMVQIAAVLIALDRP